jgi:flagellar assembly factor FliW
VLNWPLRQPIFTMVKMLRIKSDRLGFVEYREAEIITFTDGLVGFPDYNQFILYSELELKPFQWLVSLESQSVSFLVVDPFLFFPEYQIERKKIQDIIGGGGELHYIRAFVIVTIAEDFIRSTANLLGPIVMNMATMRARQLVLDDPRYTTRHLLFRKLLEDVEKAETG